jgi:MYXO-CTERM domain-containing protein
MKSDPLKLLKLVAAGGSSLAFAHSLNAATLLQFGGSSNIGANGGSPPMDETYGDNVSASNTVTGIVATVGVQGILGTPDIALQYNALTGATQANSGFDSYPSWNGRGAVLQTDFTAESPTMTLDLTPTATTGVLITSFDLDEYAGGGASVVNWAILNGATTIVSGTWNDFAVANGGRSTVNTGMTEAQAMANIGSTLSLQLTLVGGRASYQALDNLSFDQVAIPEPSGAVLGALGAGLIGLRRRRNG